MLTLGIETSGRDGSIALVDGGVLLGELALSRSGRRHARSLVSELQSLLSQRGLRPADCGCVAISIGPGSFTGLRVGVVCAKTFAYAVRCPVAAVDTFAAVAAGAPADVSELDVVADAQRGALYVGRYDRASEETWERRGEIRIVAAEDWLRDRDGGVPISGPAAHSLVSDSIGLPVLNADCWEPRASAISRLGEQAVCAGRVDDLWTLEPRYIRRPAAEDQADATTSPR